MGPAETQGNGVEEREKRWRRREVEGKEGARQKRKNCEQWREKITSSAIITVRARERERETETDREWEGQRERGREGDKETDRQTEVKIERKGDRKKR